MFKFIWALFIVVGMRIILPIPAITGRSLMVRKNDSERFYCKFINYEKCISSKEENIMECLHNPLPATSATHFVASHITNIIRDDLYCSEPFEPSIFNCNTSNYIIHCITGENYIQLIIGTIMVYLGILGLIV